MILVKKRMEDTVAFLNERRALDEERRAFREACNRMHAAEKKVHRQEITIGLLVTAVGLLIMSLFLLLMPGCAPAGEPWPADGRCGIECLDPAYPVICEVERTEGVVWTCAVDGDACKAVPGLACTP